MSKVRIVNAALSKVGEKFILRGELDFTTSVHLKTDDYQREAMPQSSFKSILECLESGGILPNIDLSMRGSRCKERDGAFYLEDDVYIVDGLQRVTACHLFMANNPGTSIRLGVEVIFPMTKTEERTRFDTLNTKRLKVATNKLLFNRRETSRAVQQLYALSTNDRTFPLYDRVAWKQNFGRGDLIGAMTLAKVVGTIHHHKVNGLSNSIDGTVQHLDKIVDEVGVQVMRANTHAFYALVEECWRIRTVTHNKRAPQLKAGFEVTFARFLSDHYNFWQGENGQRLFADAPMRRKLAGFSLQDPSIERLCSSSGAALRDLYIQLYNHVNSGKRTHRLKPRTGKTMMQMSVGEMALSEETEPEAVE